MGSLHSAKLAGVGLRGSAIAVVVGVVIGACCAFAMWKVGETVGSRISKSRSEVHKKLGIPCALFLGDLLVSSFGSSWQLGGVGLAAACYRMDLRSGSDNPENPANNG
jgi:hypothetical protein